MCTQIRFLKKFDHEKSRFSAKYALNGRCIVIEETKYVWTEFNMRTIKVVVDLQG